MRTIVAIAFAVFALVACGDDDATVDAEAFDAAPADAVVVDAGGEDAAMDAAVTVDAVDAAAEIDAGVVDAIAADAQ